MNDPQRKLAEAFYPELARIGKAIASPTRLEILDLLRQGPRSVDDIAHETRISSANASQHLKQLRAAHLLTSHKEGQRVYYSVADDNVCRFFCSLRSLAERQLAEMDGVRKLLEDEAPAKDPEELLQMVRTGGATVIDVRPTDEYLTGHMAGAISVPLRKLQESLHRIPNDRDVVVYCRGSYCTLALEAVRALRQHGYVAHRLNLGVMDMRQRRWTLHSGVAPSPDMEVSGEGPAISSENHIETPSSEHDDTHLGKGAQKNATL